MFSGEPHRLIVDDEDVRIVVEEQIVDRKAAVFRIEAAYDPDQHGLFAAIEFAAADNDVEKCRRELHFERDPRLPKMRLYVGLAVVRRASLRFPALLRLDVGEGGVGLEAPFDKALCLYMSRTFARAEVFDCVDLIDRQCRAGDRRTGAVFLGMPEIEVLLGLGDKIDGYGANRAGESGLMAVECFLELRPDAYQPAIERPLDESACVDEAPRLERSHLHDLERLRRLGVLFRADRDDHV